jgi:hypothetical protein
LRTIISVIKARGGKLKNSIIFLAFAILCSYQANDSKSAPVMLASKWEHGVGNGVPDYEEAIAWFTGKDAAKYCVEVAGDSGVDPVIAQETVEWAFMKWSEYITRKRINDRGWNFLPIATSYQRVDKCDDSIRLKIYFGVENDEVKKFLPYRKSSLGWAVLTDINFTTQLHRGFVWISPHGSIAPNDPYPDWKDPKNLRAIVLHELGHVFGNGHIPGTIMTGHLSTTIKYGYPYQSIDIAQELTICENCLIELKGTIAYNMVRKENEPPYPIWERVFNLQNQQSDSATVESIGGEKLKLETNGKSIVIEFANKRPSYIIEYGYDEIPRFHTVYKDEKGELICFGYCYEASGYTRIGKAKLPSGETLNVLMSRNVEPMSGSSFMLFLIDENTLIPLFISDRLVE